MTDRGRDALRQSRDAFTVGPSSMRWEADRLVIEVDEIASPPLVSRVRGRIVVTPKALTDAVYDLSGDGGHLWRPFAPSCDISVELDAPGWAWTGHGYFDANRGDRALEADFSGWTWGRFPTGDGTTCFYEAQARDGSETAFGVRFDADGRAEEIPLPAAARLPRSLWAVRRATRADAGYLPRQALAMLDAPFYCRSAVTTRLWGEETTGVHEALNLDRFRWPFLKPMLAVRVPRRAGWRFD